MLNDFTLGPSQACGAFRLVPLLREKCRTDLRLGLQHDAGGAVRVPGAVYSSYIPHAFVVEWAGHDAAPLAAFGTQLGNTRRTSAVHGVFHRMAKRDDGNTLRFLPLHLAMEGLLALHFGGPTVQWGYFSREAMSSGFSPRSETSVSGWALEGFDEALRVFEIMVGQVGVLVFVADALAAAFAVPHPDDYRRLHDTLLQDFFGELLWQYAVMFPELPLCAFPIPDEGVSTLADLRAGVALMREDWAGFARTAARALDAPITAEMVYTFGGFRLERFTGDFDPATENHIGERIVAADGSVQYLKTFRLSASQTRRAYLLKQLADHDWNLEALGAKHRQTANDVMLRYANAGYEWLFRQDALDAAKAWARRWG